MVDDEPRGPRPDALAFELGSHLGVHQQDDRPVAHRVVDERDGLRLALRDDLVSLALGRIDEPQVVVGCLAHRLLRNVSYRIGSAALGSS